MLVATAVASLSFVAPPSARPAPALSTQRSAASAVRMEVRGKFTSKEDVLSASFLDILTETTDYKESSRQFRQDVYAYDDWRWHRTSGHVADAFPSVFTSGVGKALWKEIWFVIAAAVGVVAYNDGLLAISEALESVSPDIAYALASRPLLHLSLLPLTLASPALFLLLVFRTNASYDRWWEARKVWGSIINTSRDHARMAIAMVDNDELRNRMVKMVASWPRVLKFHLGPPTADKEEVLRQELVSNGLDEKTIDFICFSAHKPMTLLGLMSKAVHTEAELDSIQRQKIDQSLTLMTDHLGMCERIIKTPVPLVYTRHTARFLSWWLTFLPICLYDQLPTHWTIIPVSALIGFFLCGIEELGNQIEEPFSILPLATMGSGIVGSVFEANDIANGVLPEKKDVGGVVVPYIKQSSSPNAFVR